jgi:valyl-tRNA synthetase
MATYSSDAIRYWAASGKLGTDILFSEDQLKIGRRLVTKLWNAFRFSGEHFAGISCKAEELQAQDSLNQWLMHNLEKTYAEYLKSFENYDYHHALEVAERFLWHVFCDNYLELVKHRFFDSKVYAPEVVEETRKTLYVAGLHLLKMFAPIVPHITDTLYQSMFRKYETIPSIHNHTWKAESLQGYENNTTATTIDALIQIVANVRKLKSEKALSLKTTLNTLSVVISAEHASIHLDSGHILTLKGACGATTVTVEQGRAEASLTEDPEGWNAVVRI